jgi:ribosome recycling factor
VPPLTEERRKDLAKTAKAQAEQSRVAVRNIRRDGNEELKKLLKNGDITEDEESKYADALQTVTDNYITRVNQVLEEKETEIMEV